MIVGVLLVGCDQVFGLDRPCPEPFDAQRYFISGEIRTWHDAEEQCRALRPDGAAIFTHLVVLSDNAERLNVRNLALGIDPWVGLSDLGTESVFLWVTAEPTGPIQWAEGQPNGAEEQDCVASLVDGFHDKDCDERRPYVCECDAYPVELDRL